MDNVVNLISVQLIRLTQTQNDFYNMLKTFLKENKISLARLTSPSRVQLASSPQIPSYTSQQDYALSEKQQPASEPLIAIPSARSPTHKRRKIFEPISSPQSKITAEFPTIPNYSTVQSYEIPKEEPRGKTPKRKMKVNKQNGLCLARVTSKDLLREISKRELQQVDPEAQELERSQANDRLELLVRGQGARKRRVEELQRYNRGLERELREGRRVEDGSLVIEQAASDFTFHDTPSITSQSSLSYSNSIHLSPSSSVQFTLRSTALLSPLDAALRV